MDSLALANYGSDDDYEDSTDSKQTDSYSSQKNNRKPSTSKQDDANYDEVQMSLSEDSNDESKLSHQKRFDRDRDDERSSRDDYRSRRNRDEERSSGSRNRDDNREDKTRDRYRDDRQERGRDERSRKSKERSNRDKEDRYRDRKNRDRRRSRSRDREQRRRSRSPRRDRDNSKPRDRGGRSYSKRYDRTGSKLDRLDKMGIGLKTDIPKEPEKVAEDEPKDRFFVPGITGRFREQIEKRKLLWQKKEAETKPVAPVITGIPMHNNPGGSRTTKVWEATTFAQDTDGKVANKFKRLMGIRGASEGKETGSEVLKKQEEMFTSMEQQYEVARTATHTMRGVGLGFGSFQR